MKSFPERGSGVTQADSIVLGDVPLAAPPPGPHDFSPMSDGRLAAEILSYLSGVPGERAVSNDTWD